MTTLIDLTGQKFERLRVLEIAGRHVTSRGKIRALWRCLCDPELGGCGRETTAKSDALRGHTVRSCGCLREELRGAKSITHGATRQRGWGPEYIVWAGMRERCYCETYAKYPSYGGRGITICARWQDYAAFLADMGTKPTPAHTIDRVDNSKGYWCGRADCSECGPLARVPNCQWATQKTQARNRRSNRVIEYRGESRCLAEWSDLLGVPARLIWGRMNLGWSFERAVTEPVNLNARFGSSAAG